ncbi:WhiB family transcriptional regulator [Mycobacterium talmoniae]|uniref:WhiB family transcriptional regulator n=1 Tax=Mycobacterium talmoniae TaxID=1858794 RepID=UPI0013F4C6FD|nr:WhiB family transcriptional regulator [Mycobacterium talmoniae]
MNSANDLDLDLIADETDVGDSDALAFAADIPDEPVPCDVNPERWDPDNYAASPEDRLRFRTSVLPKLAQECDRCHFRIRCAVTALESRADCGIWAGVQARGTQSPHALHRRRLLKILAEYLAAPDTADNDARREILSARITTMLQRRPELREPFTEATAAATHDAAAADAPRQRRRPRTPAPGPHLSTQLRLALPMGA